MAEDGSSERILIGAATEAGDYYAKLDGQDTVYLIGSALFNQTSYGLNELLELERFPIITGTDIRSIAAKQDKITENYKLPDGEKLDALADSLSGLTVKSCVNYKVTDAELAGYGLENPEMIITYTYDENGTEETFSLSIGSMNQDSTCYYTKAEGSKMVNEIDKTLLDECRTLISELSK